MFLTPGKIGFLEDTDHWAGTGFSEDNFSMDWGRGDGLGMILFRSARPRALTFAVHGRIQVPL